MSHEAAPVHEPPPATAASITATTVGAAAPALVERDLDQPEDDAAALLALLLPPPAPTLPLQHHSFALAYNAALLHGWVKQSSPACAAASLAGACNALGRLPRSAAGAWTQERIVPVYASVLDDRLKASAAK